MDMRVNIAGVEWKNPVTVASGTFGSGAEFADFVDLNKLGAVTTKGVANVPWSGNPTPRVAETYGGMMNAIGLQNPGMDVFCERDIPFLKQYDTKIIVNVCGHAPEEYFAVVERLASEDIDMMEINISCPNVNAGFLAFGQDPKQVEKLTAEIKKRAKQPIIMKLTPNVTDITEIAKAAVAEMVRQQSVPVFHADAEQACELMEKGVIVRQLLLPGQLQDAKKIVKYLHETYGNQIYLSLMSQFTPLPHVEKYPELNRRVSARTYEKYIDYCLDLGVEQGFIQEGEVAEESFIPDFNGEGV